MYSLISMILVRPSAPPRSTEIMRNEGREMRKNLEKMGISTPGLISISDVDLVEEYIEGGDLYVALASGQSGELAFAAGRLTGRERGWDDRRAGMQHGGQVRVVVVQRVRQDAVDERRLVRRQPRRRDRSLERRLHVAPTRLRLVVRTTRPHKQRNVHARTSSRVGCGTKGGRVARPTPTQLKALVWRGKTSWGCRQSPPDREPPGRRLR